LFTLLKIEKFLQLKQNMYIFGGWKEREREREREREKMKMLSAKSASNADLI